MGLRHIFDAGTLGQNLIICTITGLAFSVLLPLLGVLLRITEISTLYDKIFRRLLPWQKKMAPNPK
jgi:hypothetical protein